MTTLVVGASGATGRLLVDQLLSRGEQVRVVVRGRSELFDAVEQPDNLSVIRSSLLDMSDAELAQLVDGCDAVASCLGHNLSFKGMFGQPRRLVTDATRRLCRAIRSGAPEDPVKFILMNATGNSNRDLDERVSFAQQCVIWLLRVFLPPHVDNEQAAEYLRTEVGQHDRQIEWVAVRPDGLVNEAEVTTYTEHPSPTRSAIFDAGKTSRINVAHFMTELITRPDKWARWKGQMPVISNQDEEGV